MYASETRFHCLADSLAQLVWTVDASGRLSFGNAAWRARTSISAGNTFADRYLLTLHPQDRTLWKTDLGAGAGLGRIVRGGAPDPVCG